LRRHQLLCFKLTLDLTLQLQYTVAVQNKFSQLDDLPQGRRWRVLEVRLLRDPQLSQRCCRHQETHYGNPGCQQTLSLSSKKTEERNPRTNIRKETSAGDTKAKAGREAYLTSLAEEIENNLKHNCVKSVFRSIKQLSRRNLRPSTHTINNADGSPCEMEDYVLLRWREHFELASNHPPLADLWRSATRRGHSGPKRKRQTKFENTIHFYTKFYLKWFRSETHNLLRRTHARGSANIYAVWPISQHCGSDRIIHVTN